MDSIAPQKIMFDQIGYIMGADNVVKFRINVGSDDDRGIERENELIVECQIGTLAKLINFRAFQLRNISYDEDGVIVFTMSGEIEDMIGDYMFGQY